MSVPARIDLEIDRCRPISVLLVDDSAVARAAMSRMVEARADLILATALGGAAHAVDWLGSHRVDVIVLDLMMPGWDGLAALPQLLASGQGAKVLVVSSTARAGAEATLSALAAGASDTLAKPAAGHLNQLFGTILTDRIVRIGRASRHADHVAAVNLRRAPTTPVALLGIGASTGGLSALSQFFAALPPTFDAPILVTQHLPKAFMTYFAEQLSTMASRPASVAIDGSAIRSGEIAVAPGDGHLEVERRGTRLVARISYEAVETRCMPSVDPMFAAIAADAGVAAAGVVLTGMGRDGCSGAARLAETGATVMVQDATSSAVWGMPGAVAKAGHASAIGTPSDLARNLAVRGSA